GGTGSAGGQRLSRGRHNRGPLRPAHREADRERRIAHDGTAPPRAVPPRVSDPRHPDQRAVLARAGTASGRPRRTSRHRPHRSRDRAPGGGVHACGSSPSSRRGGSFSGGYKPEIAVRVADRRRPVDDAGRVAELTMAPKPVRMAVDGKEITAAPAGDGCWTLTSDAGIERVWAVGTSERSWVFHDGRVYVLENRASRRGSRGHSISN